MANGNGMTTAQLDREVIDILAARQRREARQQAAQPPRSSSVPSHAEYERHERRDAQRRLDEVEKAPLAERKESAANFFDAMRDHPELVAERVGWLLDGSYGYGQKLMARAVLGSPRMNRSAALTQMIAAFEWSSPSAMTRAAWKKLTKGQQAALEKAVQATIRGAENEEK